MADLERICLSGSNLRRHTSFSVVAGPQRTQHVRFRGRLLARASGLQFGSAQFTWFSDMTLFGNRIPIFFSLVVWFVLWEIIGRTELSTIIPPFSRVIAAGITMIPTQKFSTAVSISLRSFALGMALAPLIGIPIGILMARVATIGKIFGMWVNIFLSALPEILAGVRLGVIRGVKGVVIGQLLIAILGVGELFELYSQHFLMEEFWALVLIVFMFAFVVSEAVALLERRVEYYASTR